MRSEYFSRKAYRRSGLGPAGNLADQVTLGDQRVKSFTVEDFGIFKFAVASLLYSVSDIIEGLSQLFIFSSRSNGFFRNS